MTEKHHTIQELHKEGTGRWLFDGDQFVEWQNYPGYLWIQGQSGTGKSVLSDQKLFDDQQLFVHLGKTKSSAVAYFYFDFRDEKRQSVDIALRRIILQLSAQSPDPYGALDRQYMLSKGQVLPTYRDLLEVLQELLANVAHTYIVLDVLDECKEADQVRLLELISTLRSWTDRSIGDTSLMRGAGTGSGAAVPGKESEPGLKDGSERNPRGCYVGIWAREEEIEANAKKNG
ncbi:hypothetical protein B0H13DRAFT_1850099 [Mycena leptocephala]|nr:hypothetical protein B0H13DRAFT_1850099 [Mycena leptocephala]